MGNEITISTEDVNLRQMVIKLMGRGMSMEKSVEGQFVLNLDNILDLVNRVAQRVLLQNHCQMSDLYAEFEFADGSKETVPSYESLQSYRCVNSATCKSAKISFAFLVSFAARAVEKQSIDIEIKTPAKRALAMPANSFAEESPDLFGKLMIRVEYTDVTWANDLKNLFQNYAEAHVETFALRRLILSIFNFQVLFTLGLICMLGLLIMFAATLKNPPGQTPFDKYMSLHQSSDELQILASKIDYLIMRSSPHLDLTGLVPPLIVICALFVVFLCFTMLLRNIPRSVILLSPEARLAYDRQEAARNRVNIYNIGGIVLAIVIAIASANLDRLIQSIF